MAATLNQTDLQRWLSYDPATGVFTWLRSRTSRRGKGAPAGSITAAGYVEIGLLGKQYLAHRLAFLYMVGAQPTNEVDHINHDRADNRWANLRLANRTANGRNLRMRSNNTSGHTGVYWNTAKEKWQAQIMVNHKCINLGRSADLQEAVSLRKAAECKYAFHQNHGK